MSVSMDVEYQKSTDDQPILSQRHYQHTDQDTGTQLVCDKCPAGTYVSIHCSPTSVRECSPCPKGTFTRGENGVQQCHRCRSPCPAGFIEKTPCTATQDRICTCPPNTFLSGDGAAVCKPHSLCPPGKRVKKQGSEKKDVVCKQCSEGTFSDVKSSATQCRNHTDCQVQGLVLLSPGTREKDNICGPLSTAPSSASTTASGGSGLVQEPIISSIFPKGPMQDPSSIMEKAIQKKPPAPLTQVREKWIYYANGQGKPTGSFGVGNCFSTEVETQLDLQKSL
uniref:TNFR-Cys domain-containing protein n=1 Tax=Haplochromis burtoni TaxID=8153 RepID=A0A3Q2V701_HAPBU